MTVTMSRFDPVPLALALGDQIVDLKDRLNEPDLSEDWRLTYQLYVKSLQGVLSQLERPLRRLKGTLGDGPIVDNALVAVAEQGKA